MGLLSCHHSDRRTLVSTRYAAMSTTLNRVALAGAVAAVLALAWAILFGPLMV